jgi:preprotein translocase subunit SecD
MRGRRVLFNTYLCLAVLAGLGLGCQSVPNNDTTTYKSVEDDPAKQLTALRLHVESAGDATQKTIEVPVYRARPTLVRVSADPFLDEQYVMSAEVLDEPGGGHSIQVEFTRKGKWILDQYTTQNMKRRIGVFASFGQERWLAAPVIRQVQTDGKFTFTPDATREEADRIVRGLNNFAREQKHDPRF